MDYTTYLIGVENHVRPLRTATAWIHSGSTELNEMYSIPSGTPPGAYRITKLVVNRCATTTYHSQTFDVPITILPAK